MNIEQHCNTLYNGDSLSATQSQDLFHHIMTGAVSDTVLSAVLIAMKMRGETAEEISGAAQGILEKATPFPRPDMVFGDIVGTGGDDHNTFNVSSTSAIVAAGCGLKICKHGNRKVSSLSGAADVLSMLGIDLDASPHTSADLLKTAGLCFLMAPNYHPSVKHAIGVRQSLKTRTIFNILGPLINPARPDYIVNGVYNSQLLPIIAKAHQNLGVQRGIIVHGSGLDEVCLHGTTDIVEIQKNSLQSYTLSPDDFGLPTQSIDSIAGRDAHTNALITQAIINGKAPPQHENIVAVNVAIALRCADVQPDLKKGVEMAKTAMHNGTAAKALDCIATHNQPEG